jgi:hypothetical protein
MRQIKVIFLSLCILSILVILFSLLIPAHTKLSRAITIRKKMPDVKMELMQLQNWNHWNTGITEKIALDSMQYNAATKSLLVKGFSVRITAETDSSIHYVMQKGTGEILESEVNLWNHQDSCTVNWMFHFRSKWYPWQKFRAIFIDNMYGPSLDSNLTALKKYIER